MPTRPISPVEAEATGQPHLVATYKGHEFKLPTDVDDWPLDLIAVSVGTAQDGTWFVHHPTLALAMQQLLGVQWYSFNRSFPLRKDLLPASREFAAAAGFTADTGDLAFGALPLLLATISQHQDAVEATLADRNIDYRDRWRFDADGQRLLTLRQIHVRLKFRRPDSALSIALNGGRMPYQAGDLLLMDLYEVLTGKQHPSRPLTAKQLEKRKAVQSKKAKESAAVAEYRKRAEKRQNRHQTALETARANAQPGKAAHASRQEVQKPD